MANQFKFGTSMVLARLSADPSSPLNGEMYYNTSTNKVRAYQNGAWADVISTGSLTGLTLNSQNIIVGNGSNLSASVDTSAVGDISASSSTGLNIKAGVIVDADINASAAISLSKLAALTASRAIQSDGSGVISVSAVTSTELGYVSGVTSAIQTQLNGKLNLSGGTMSGDIDMDGNSITDLADPVSAQDAATKAYVDAVAEGLKPKAAVRAGSLADIDLTTGGLLTIDTVTLVDGDRVLVKDQTAAEENGIYIAHSGAWTRSTDFDSLTPIDEINGAYTFIQEGSQAGQGWVQTDTVTTLDTDPINFVFFSSIAGLVGGNGIDITGNTVSVDHDGQGLTFASAQLALELDGTTLSKSASGLKVATGGITNTEINASAAIDRSKLASGTAHALVVNNASGVLSSLGPLTDGQLLIGSTGNAAVAAAITEGRGITVINAPGSIEIVNIATQQGDIFEYSNTLANDQDTPVNVAGFAFANASIRSFEAMVSVSIDATTPLNEAFELRGIQIDGNWNMSVTSVGDDSQIVFTITSSGQIQYTSGDYAGFTTSNMQARARVTQIP